MARPLRTPGLFPDDELLRDAGFVIVRRDGNGREAVWERDKREYPHSAAVKKAHAERNELLQKLEASYPG